MAKCVQCGGYAYHLSVCGDCHVEARLSLWPVTIGTAIALFLRRAEVAELVETIDDARGDMVQASEWRYSSSATLSPSIAKDADRDYAAARNRFDTALSRLATLALSGSQQ